MEAEAEARQCRRSALRLIIVTVVQEAPSIRDILLRPSPVKTFGGPCGDYLSEYVE